MTDQRGIITPQELQDVTISATKVQPSLITLPTANGRPLVTIHPDGRLEFGPDYTPDAAAQAFWEAVQRFAPDPMTREYGAPLAARINTELAAGQHAREQVERLDQMAASWLERLPDTILTATAVDAIHAVTREGA